MGSISEDVELHSAFVWDCDNCGAENFTRTIEAGINEPIYKTHDHAAYFIGMGELDEEDENIFEVTQLIARMAVDPGIVTCKNCKREFFTYIPTGEEIGEDE